MATMSDIITRARVVLSDPTGLRYNTSELLDHTNAAVAEAYRLRPDLFFSTIGTPPTALASGGTFPLPTTLEDPAVQFVAGRAEMRGDVYAKEGRAPAYVMQFAAALRGA